METISGSIDAFVDSEIAKLKAKASIDQHATCMLTLRENLITNGYFAISYPQTHSIRLESSSHSRVHMIQ